MEKPDSHPQGGFAKPLGWPADNDRLESRRVQHGSASWSFDSSRPSPIATPLFDVASSFDKSTTVELPAYVKLSIGLIDVLDSQGFR